MLPYFQTRANKSYNQNFSSHQVLYRSWKHKQLISGNQGGRALDYSGRNRAVVTKKEKTVNS